MLPVSCGGRVGGVDCGSGVVAGLGDKGAAGRANVLHNI